MIVAEYLASLRRLPVGQVGDLVGDAPFLVLAPHCDDEALGCGGLLALSTRTRSDGHVLVLTDGAGSHPRSVAFPPERLVPLRQAETVAALAVLGLGPERVRFLGQPDAGLPVSGPGFDSVVAAVVAAARRVGARTLFVTWGHDPHCDHEAASAIAMAAARALAPVRLWAYPIWGLHRDPASTLESRGPAGLRLDIAETQDLKHRALRCYASQMTPLIDDDPAGFCFTDEQLAPFLERYERFIELHP